MLRGDSEFSATRLMRTSVSCYTCMHALRIALVYTGYYNVELHGVASENIRRASTETECGASWCR